MGRHQQALAASRARIKELIIEGLNLEGVKPEMIGDHDPLFGEGLELDSVDALEVIVLLEKEYDVTIDGEKIDMDVFASVASLADWVARLRNGEQKPSTG